jgi:hypothetical protein
VQVFIKSITPADQLPTFIVQLEPEEENSESPQEVHAIKMEDDTINVKAIFERKTSKVVKNMKLGFVIKVYAKKPQNYTGEDIEIEWEDVRINAYMNSNERE